MLLSMKNNINSKKNNLIIKENIKNKPFLKNNTIKNIMTISSESTTEVNTYRVNEKNSKNNLRRFTFDIISSNININNLDEETKRNKKDINNQLKNEKNNKKKKNIEHNKNIDNLLDEILAIEGKRIVNSLSESIIMTNDGRFIINSKKLFSSKYEDSLLNTILNFSSFIKHKNNESFNKNYKIVDSPPINVNNNNNKHFFSPQSTKQQSRKIYRNIYLLEEDNNLFHNKANYKGFSPPIINQKPLRNKHKKLNNKSYGNNTISLTQGNISKANINKDNLYNNNSIIKRKVITKIDDNPLPKKKKRYSKSFY